MFKNKIISLFIALMLVVGTYSVVGAYPGAYNGNNNMMGNNYNGQMNGSNNYPGYNGQGYNGMMRSGGMMGMMNMMNMMMGGGMGYGEMMGYGNGMMGSSGPGVNGNTDYSLSALGMTEENVKNLAIELVERQFGPEYQVSDIFIFDNSPYYVSVIEIDSEQGAFELLFDPYSKVIYPEYGPNMMWNTENGMNNMMGWSAPLKDNILSRQEALESADKFAQANDFTVEDEGHQFPGYYTFHTGDNNDNTKGMLSVNAYTGQVWYHNWHGNLSNVIEVEKHLE